MIKNPKLASRYAQALYDFSIEMNHVENVYHDLVGRGEKVDSRKLKVKSGDFPLSTLHSPLSIKGDNHADLHEIAGMAGSHESGGDDLQANEKISERGDVFADESDSAGGSVNSGEHSGRKREANKEGISTLSVHSKRFPLRTGDSPDYCGTSKVYQNGRNDGYTETNGYSRTYADSFDEVAEKKVEYGVDSR